MGYNFIHLLQTTKMRFKRKVIVGHAPQADLCEFKVNIHKHDSSLSTAH
jgi:hypothetical protein